MTASLILGLISVLQLMASIRLFYLALNQEASERVRQRLTAGQVAPVVEKPGWAGSTARLSAPDWAIRPNAWGWR